LHGGPAAYAECREFAGRAGVEYHRQHHQKRGADPVRSTAAAANFPAYSAAAAAAATDAEARAAASAAASATAPAADAKTDAKKDDKKEEKKEDTKVASTPDKKNEPAKKMYCN
jgi:hypothetical protein